MAVKLVRLSTATSNRPDIEWLADGRILKGNTNLIYGDDGLCKSWVASSLCAAMSNPALGGRSILGEAVMHDAPGSMECIYMCGEDPYIADKLAKCGATDRVLLLGGDDGSGEYTDPYAVRIGDPDFAAMCAAHPGALIVLDPVKAYAPRGCKLNDGLSVQTGIHQPLRKLSIQHGITWLLICHTNKTGEAVATSSPGAPSCPMAPDPCSQSAPIAMTLRAMWRLYGSAIPSSPFWIAAAGIATR